MTTPHFVNLCITIAICVARIAGAKHEAYQALAHCYVFGVFGYWLHGFVKSRAETSIPLLRLLFLAVCHDFYLWLFLGATAVEVVMGILVPLYPFVVMDFSGG